MTNDVRINAESDLHLNQDDKELWSNYECHYGRLYYHSDFRAEMRGQLKGNQLLAPIISNQTKIDNHCTLMFNIFTKYNCFIYLEYC